MNLLNASIAFLMGIALVIVTIPPIIRVSVAKHLYDKPNERKVSKTIVPTLGGVALFIGLTISSLIATNGYDFSDLKYLIAAIIIMFFTGLKDDLIDISALKKLMLQIAASVILIVLGNFRITNFQGIFGIYEINYALSFSLSLFFLIGLTNAFNLIDGIDGLASGVSIVIASIFGLWFSLAGFHEYSIVCFSLVGSLISFFYFNVFGKKYKIFMGDTGSLILGITLSALTIKFIELNINTGSAFVVPSAPVLALAILIIPVIDTLRVFFIRLSEKRSPFSPDMNHLHHKFLALGFTHLQASMSIVSVNIVFIALTYYLSQIVSVNNLLVIVFGLGFFIAFLPCLAFKCNKIESVPNKSHLISRHKNVEFTLQHEMHKSHEGISGSHKSNVEKAV
jgi:UDP-N-acetylmuramyl pentapeptide phosphotransferase/UDP-N-acetylglucosamine-1-phosphate transferase